MGASGRSWPKALLFLLLASAVSMRAGAIDPGGFRPGDDPGDEPGWNLPDPDEGPPPFEPPSPPEPPAAPEPDDPGGPDAGGGGYVPADPTSEPEAHDGPPIDPDPGQDPQIPPIVDGLHCVNGRVAQFPCREIDLWGHVSIAELAGTPNATLNDVWGWTDPSNGHEIALVGLSNGLAFVDVTDPTAPRFLGRMPSRTVESTWRSVKVYRNHAYVVADRAGLHGMQVFDLERLRSVTEAVSPLLFGSNTDYFGAGLSIGGGELLGSAHNIVIDEESGFAFIVGSATCGQGLHMVDLRNPLHPRFAGCFGADGYTHDAQCVVYRGPDSTWSGHEVCFASNEDTITFVDVTNKRRPRQISRTGYNGSAYTHQGWLTEDQRFFLVDDELDEIHFGHGSRTYIWDVSDLDAPRLIGTHTLPLASTDHNLFIRGNRAFLANYTSGLRILDLAEVAGGHLREVAYFDIVPENDAPGFVGAWSNYPFFASGTVLVSGIQQGLFILKPHGE
jgi:choice-of-anchor B domain-containing protein